MKKLLYVLPLIGLLSLMSCDKDDSDEIIDETLALDEGQIEIIEAADSKDLGIAIPPGLYGPNQTTPFTNATYTFIPSQKKLNQNPEPDRQYRIYIYYEEYSDDLLKYIWSKALETDVPSNRVTLKFPAYYDSGKRDKWLIAYEIGSNSYGWEYKEVTINHP